MKTPIIKRFTQFINETTELTLSDESGTERVDAITAYALGCGITQLDNYFIGSPVARYYEPEFMDEVAPVIDLFDIDEDSGDWKLKRKGKIIWTVNDYGSGGYARAHLLYHNGLTVVVIDGDDGPYIYAKPITTRI
jgi:hypothetical protein